MNDNVTKSGSIIYYHSAREGGDWCALHLCARRNLYRIDSDRARIDQQMQRLDEPVMSPALRQVRGGQGARRIGGRPPNSEPGGVECWDEE
jgi:hypothetical protein